MTTSPPRRKRTFTCVFRAIPPSYRRRYDPGSWQYEPIDLCCPKMRWAKRDSVVEFKPDGPLDELYLYHEDSGWDTGDHLKDCPFCNTEFKYRIVE